MKRTFKQILITIALIICAIASLFSYTIYISFQENYPVSKGSYPYYLLIDSQIRQLPLIYPVNEPTFYATNIIDGQNPRWAKIVYLSFGPITAIQLSFKQYMKKLGLKNIDWSKKIPFFSKHQELYSNINTCYGKPYDKYICMNIEQTDKNFKVSVILYSHVE